MFPTRRRLTQLLLVAVALLLPSFAGALAQEKQPTQKLRDLDTHCPFTPPDSLDQWQSRAEQLRLQLRVSLGLHALPELEPVAPSIYGLVERDDYTIEKVTFESLPGLFVTGNLYRPKSTPTSANGASAKRPGILAPHGHWEDARFYEAPASDVRQLLATGAERFETAARNHIQARCVQLARMGCVVFHWDMLGYCDSQQINMQRAHRFAQQPGEDAPTENGWLLYSPMAEMHAQSVLGLQALATQRAVDMLLTLPDVDAQRIGISGASGGGTQSFLGAALDERIQVAFPAVMVSTGMQGGCTCENACLLRTGTGNVEIAGLIAPRPLGLTAADDWTRTMPEDGFPELQKLYSLYDRRNHVALFPALHFGHNFNHVSRTHLYGWINQHFNLGFETPVLERDFVLATRGDLTVWDAEHPVPPSGPEFERQLLKAWAQATDAHLQSLLDGNEVQKTQLASLVQDGWKVCLGLTTPLEPQPATHSTAATNPSRPIPSLIAVDTDESGSIDVPSDAIILTFRTGDELRRLVMPNDAANSTDTLDAQPLVPNPRLAAAYTFGYNPTAFTKEAHQFARTIRRLAADNLDAKFDIQAAGRGAAIAAAAVFIIEQTTAPEDRPSIELQIHPRDFRFASAESIRSPNFQPAAAKYFDLPGLVSSLQTPIKIIATDEQLQDFTILQPLTNLHGGTQVTVPTP